jgi:hypothetical protein
MHPINCLRLGLASFLVVGSLACGARSGGPSSGDDTCGCVTERVEWGHVGGWFVNHPKSALDVCNTFVHQGVASSSPAVSCEQSLGDCRSGIGAEAVTRAMADADVQAAIAAAPVAYGSDGAGDAGMFRIKAGEASIYVSVLPCSGEACDAIPAGVDALAQLLRELTRQELSRAACSKFPR